MRTDYVSELVRLAATAKPNERPSPADWKTVERSLGLKFPTDFKALVSALGTGRFGAGLYLRNPCASSGYLRLSHEALISYRSIASGVAGTSGIILYPQPHGAVVIGGVDRQDFLLRPEKTGKRLSELVWWNLDAEEVRELGTSVARLLYELYLGRIEEPWAEELRSYFWRGGTVPFFRSWAGAEQ